MLHSPQDGLFETSLTRLPAGQLKSPVQSLINPGGIPQRIALVSHALQQMDNKVVLRNVQVFIPQELHVLAVAVEA